MDKKIITSVVVAAAIAGGVGYMVGKNSTASTPDIKGQAQFGQGSDGAPNSLRGQGGQGGRRGPGMRGGMLSGEIISRDATSMTIKMDDGTSRIVFVGDKAEITVTSSSTAAALVSGAHVRVFGQQGDAGAVDAMRIELRNDAPVAKSPSNN